jgi:hypothetical protein
MSQDSSKDLLADILAFVAKWNMSEAQFGATAVHSQQLIYSLRRGRKCRAKTEARIRDFMAKGDPGRPIRRRPSPEQYGEAIRRNAEAERQAGEFRRTDPVERAKTWIRSRGWHCFEAAITRPEHHGKYFIGARLASRDELLEFARRKGWGG